MKLATRYALASMLASHLHATHVDEFLDFEGFVARFDKAYADEEFDMRRDIYEDNLRRIAEINSQNLSYKLAVNEFADMSRDEFRVSHFGVNHPRKREFLGTDRKPASYRGRHQYSGAPVPESVDWTQLGAVTAVKDQQMCGSCYSFSATGALEGRLEIATGKLVSLSEQQIVDCSDDNGNEGCNGGLMDFVFQYVSDHGLCSEEDYPYVADKQDTCMATNCNPAVPEHEVTGYIDVHPQDTEALMEALAQGPVSVAIEADETVFQFYKSGVLTGSCGSNLDHGVLAVGYGKDANGQEFWKVKNSWGEGWGDHGYIYLTKNVEGPGECGIMLQASYPVIEKSTSVVDEEEVTREEV